MDSLRLEVLGPIIGGLVVVPVLISTVRAIFGVKEPEFNIAVSERRAASEGWLHRSLVTFDISFNVIVLRGQQDETISTHAWRAANEGKMWGYLMCDWLNLFQPNHGEKAAAGDLERATVRVAILKKSLGIS